jgi:hypothetical protein
VAAFQAATQNLLLAWISEREIALSCQFARRFKSSRTQVFIVRREPVSMDGLNKALLFLTTVEFYLAVSNCYIVVF